MLPVFNHEEYVFRKKVFKIFGGAFHIYDSSGNIAFYSKQKAFKLREDFRVFSDETQSTELLKIKTPEVIDFSATYSVTDSTSGSLVGALKRKGLKSMIKDEWLFYSKEGQEIGILTEKSLLSALISRFINLIPQTYVVKAEGKIVAILKQHFNPFVLKYTLTILDADSIIDPRLLIAVGILLAGIEGRQQ